MASRLTTCTFCGVGCGLYLETAGNKVVGTYPSTEHPASQGKICVRGWHVHEVASSPDRLKTPLLKKEGKLVPVSWEEALSFIARRVKEIKAAHGPDAIALLNSPRCSNEESYLFQKLGRAVIGTNNVDHGAGVYGNNSVEVLLEMLGVPATTNSVKELEKSEVIVVDGVDLGKQLPTLGGAVLRAKLKGAKLVVIGERRQRVAENADVFLQIKPGTEALLYGAMAKVVMDAGFANKGFIQGKCEEYEKFSAEVKGYDLLAAAQGCGVPAEQIEAAARLYGGAKAAAILYSTGAEARDAQTVQALVNLALVSGQLGKEGAGIFALAEHNNLQGVCDVGMMPNRLPGYRPVADAGARAEVERLWKAAVPTKPGLTGAAALAGAEQGKVKALWLLRYDPVNTAICGDAAAALKKCELVVAQHIFLTETAKLADVVLPTTAFGEEEVTFTSAERRIQIAAQVVEPAADVVPAWKQLAEVARRLGADWKYGKAAEVMAEIAAVVPFYSGVTYESLGQEFGRQWPCTKEKAQGTGYLFADGQPKKFRFAAVPKKPVVATSEQYPVALVFGNSNYYWNQNVLIQHSETLKREYRMLVLDYPAGFVEVSNDDAKALGIRDGQKIVVKSASGSAKVAAKVSGEVKKGTVFVPYFVHQLQQQLSGASAGAKVLPVRLEKEAV